MSEKRNDAAIDVVTVPRGEGASRAAAEAREKQSSRKAGDAQTPGPTEITDIRRSTGKARATQSHRDKYDFVKVGYQKRDYDFDGVVYHAGYEKEIPEDLAAAIGLSGERISHSLTRREEIEAGLDKAEKHPTAVGDQANRPFDSIPVSDPARELPTEEEREAGMANGGVSTEQVEEQNKQQAKEQQAAQKSAQKATK